MISAGSPNTINAYRIANSVRPSSIIAKATRHSRTTPNFPIKGHSLIQGLYYAR